MERKPDWANEQVQKEIADYMQNFGFSEKEAVVFWHIQQAQNLLSELRQADINKEMDRQDEMGEERSAEDSIYDLITDVAIDESRVWSHFSAIRRELAIRVLQRNYPQGWGSAPGPAEESPGK